MNKDYLDEAREKALDFILIQGAEIAGLYEELTSPATISEVGDRLDMNERSLKIVLLALEDLNILSKNNGDFELSSQGRKLFEDKDDPEFIGQSHRHSYHIIKRWLEIPEILKTGEPASRDEEDSEEGTKAFMHAMNSRQEQSVNWTVKQIIDRVQNTNRIIDIGGGPGQYSKKFSEHFDEVVLFDLPEVIDYVGDTFNLNSFDNIGLVEGDMSECLPEGPFDAAFLGDICHMWSEKQNQNLFNRIASILDNKGVLALVDFVRGYSEWAPVFAVNMLVNTENGSTYDFKEYSSWLENAGFEDIELGEVPEKDSQLILGTKK